MLNNLAIQAQQILLQTQNTVDPVSILLEQLSSGNNIKVKFYNEEVPVPRSNEIITNKVKLDINSTNESNNQPPNNIFKLFSNRRSPGFPTQTQKEIIKKLKAIPIYTVVNSNNEIIIASSRDSSQKNTMEQLQSFYKQIAFWSHDEGTVSLILFFMNKEDASSYLHEICRKDPQEAEKLGVNVKTIGLDTFYRFNRTSPPGLQARLVGDLREFEFVLETATKEEYITLNPKQRTTMRWFQGTPIYSIRLNKASNPNELKKYSINGASYSKYIFFKKEDVDKAWKSYIGKHKNSKVDTKPTLELYNLENLLIDLEGNGSNEINELILVPPYKSNRESTSEAISSFKVEYSKQEKLIHGLKLKFENLKRFYKGLIWLITSDTLPSEENSW